MPWCALCCVNMFVAYLYAHAGVHDIPVYLSNPAKYTYTHRDIYTYTPAHVCKHVVREKQAK